jgi:hypothetical protein
MVARDAFRLASHGPRGRLDRAKAARRSRPQSGGIRLFGSVFRRVARGVVAGGGAPLHLAVAPAGPARGRAGRL